MRLHQQVISVASGVSQVASRHLFSRIHLCKVSPALTVHPDKTWIRCILRTFFVGMQSVGFGVASSSLHSSSRLSDRMSDSSHSYQLASGWQASASLALRMLGYYRAKVCIRHNQVLLSDRAYAMLQPCRKARRYASVSTNT